MNDADSPLIEVELEAMAYGGSALGRHDGRVVFIPYTIPGERVSAQIQSDRGRIAFAEGVQLLDASADRVYPVCQHFGPNRCGGCQWQHIDYTAQLLIKQDVLADQLERVGGIKDPDVRAVVASPQQWHYNYHMTFMVDNGGQVGLRSAANDIQPIEVCEVLHPDLLELYDQLDFAAETEGINRVQLVRASDGEKMVVLSTDAEEAPSLELDMPGSINLLLPDNAPINLAGNTHVVYEIGDHAFRVTAGSTFRQNVDAVPALVEAVVAAVGDAKSVIDLYAGVGLFGAFLTQTADYVTLVESYPPAATDADENTADYEHVDVIEGNVEDVLAVADEAYDAAILNPPNSGMSVAAIDALVALDIPVLVYVSGDAATLARDISRLEKHGYALDYVQPFDLAPHTYYAEIVARLIKTLKRESKSA